MMTGTSVVSELGGPMILSASGSGDPGPSHPSTPTTHVMDRTSPVSDRNVSAIERVKDEDQRRDKHQRQQDQRRHPFFRCLLILFLDNRR